MSDASQIVPPVSAVLGIVSTGFVFVKPLGLDRRGPP